MALANEERQTIIDKQTHTIADWVAVSNYDKGVLRTITDIHQDLNDHIGGPVLAYLRGHAVKQDYFLRADTVTTREVLKMGTIGGGIHVYRNPLLDKKAPQRTVKWSPRTRLSTEDFNTQLTEDMMEIWYKRDMQEAQRHPLVLEIPLYEKRTRYIHYRDGKMIDESKEENLSFPMEVFSAFRFSDDQKYIAQCNATCHSILDESITIEKVDLFIGGKAAHTFCSQRMSGLLETITEAHRG